MSERDRTLSRLRAVHDRLKKEAGPIAASTIDQLPEFRELFEHAKPEDVVAQFDGEPEVRLAILEYLRLRRETRAVGGLVGRMDPGSTGRAFYRGPGGTQVIDLHLELFQTLRALTGAPVADDAFAWSAWWTNNRSRFPGQLDW